MKKIRSPTRKKKLENYRLLKIIEKKGMKLAKVLPKEAGVFKSVDIP